MLLWLFLLGFAQASNCVWKKSTKQKKEYAFELLSERRWDFLDCRSVCNQHPNCAGVFYTNTNCSLTSFYLPPGEADSNYSATFKACCSKCDDGCLGYYGNECGGPCLLHPAYNQSIIHGWEISGAEEFDDLHFGAQQNITAITAYCGAFIDALEVTYGNLGTAIHGTYRAFPNQTYFLAPDDYIITAAMRSNIMLRIWTFKGDSFTFQGSRGSGDVPKPARIGERLVALQGRAMSYVEQIVFVYGPLHQVNENAFLESPLGTPRYRRDLSWNLQEINKHPQALSTVVTVLIVFGFFYWVDKRKEEKTSQNAELLRLQQEYDKELEKQKIIKWTNELTQNWSQSFWARYTRSLQTSHQWGSIAFRSEGTHFKRRDRIKVSLLILLVSMALAGFFYPPETPIARGWLLVLKIFLCSIPAFFFNWAFSCTVDLSWREKWLPTVQPEQQPRIPCAPSVRNVLNLILLLSYVGLVFFISGLGVPTSIEIGCEGFGTGSWLMDSILLYLVSVCFLEPIQIALLVLFFEPLQQTSAYKHSMEKLKGCKAKCCSDGRAEGRQSDSRALREVEQKADSEDGA